MTDEPVLFDTWAWWEVLHETPTGQALSRSHLEAAGSSVLTVDYALAEVAAKLVRNGKPELVDAALGKIEARGEVVPVRRAEAATAGRLLPELRRVAQHAGLADAVMLAVARSRGVKLVSGDPCFEGQRDVVRK